MFWTVETMLTFSSCFLEVLLTISVLTHKTYIETAIGNIFLWLEHFFAHRDTSLGQRSRPCVTSVWE